MAKKEKIGVVVSDKMEKTVVVAVDFKYRHPVYSKIVFKTKKYLVHDEQQCVVGDKVILEETRPLSKRKRWRVKRILNRSVLAI